MEITVRYIPGCPSRRLAEVRLAEALEILGRLDAVVIPEEVGSREAAARMGFRGSPSILVDGRDPFAGGSAPEGLACRVYATEDGVQGAPSVLQLVRILS